MLVSLKSTSPLFARNAGVNKEKKPARFTHPCNKDEPLNDAQGLIVKVQAHDMALVDAHVLRHKGLEMENHLAASLDAVFVEGGPPDDLRLEHIVRLRYQFPCQRLEYGRGVYAVREQVVELAADEEDGRGAALLKDLVGYLRDQGFPVGWWDMCLL